MSNFYISDLEFEKELFKLCEFEEFEEIEEEIIEEFDDGWTDPIESLRRRA